MIESKTPEKCMFEWQLLVKGSSTLFLRNGKDFRLLPTDERKRLIKTNGGLPAFEIEVGNVSRERNRRPDLSSSSYPRNLF